MFLKLSIVDPFILIASKCFIVEFVKIFHWSEKEIFFIFLGLAFLTKNLILPKYSKKTKPSYHLFIININFDKLNKKKDDFIKYLNKNKIFAQFHYIPIYKFRVFKERKIKLIGSEKYYKKSISIHFLLH